MAFPNLQVLSFWTQVHIETPVLVYLSVLEMFSLILFCVILNSMNPSLGLPGTDSNSMNPSIERMYLTTSKYLRKLTAYNISVLNSFMLVDLELLSSSLHFISSSLYSTTHLFLRFSLVDAFLPLLFAGEMFSYLGSTG